VRLHAPSVKEEGKIKKEKPRIKRILDAKAEIEATDGGAGRVVSLLRRERGAGA
jgi:hypothetical protein